MSHYRYQQRGTPCLSPLRCSNCKDLMPKGYQALTGVDTKDGKTLGIFCSLMCMFDAIEDAGGNTREKIEDK